MDIAGISMILNQAKVQQQASISVMKLAIDSSENSSQLIKELAETNTKIINPNIGQNINIKV